ncbi:hypothetical protein HaLaN_24897 [Haematococcus lacustris]|uniref:Uncharacterized protein n=1 Tax=Haematococcus lacustris TaxID=44745 RepID=A0A699ZXG2_HAELA|nr:hypothetical protein HaLaN_24897 [Haematococcus lacustris]
MLDNSQKLDNSPRIAQSSTWSPPPLAAPSVQPAPAICRVAGPNPRRTFDFSGCTGCSDH